MQKSPEEPRSRPTSRRSSVSLPHRSTVKKEKDKNIVATSAHSTPKKTVKTTLDFMVTGKQLLKKSDRANSLPGAYRRPSIDSIRAKRLIDSPKKVNVTSRSKDTSVEDDMSLDLSQVSDFEDTASKYGIKQKFQALATSTPKPGSRGTSKARSGSLQSQLYSQKMESSRRSQKSLDDSRSRDSTLSGSKDSYRTSSSGTPYRCGTEDYSSVSPEYSQSSVEGSPRTDVGDTPRTPHANSYNVSSCQDSDTETKIEEVEGPVGPWGPGGPGAWGAGGYGGPVGRYYDQCPTPYRTETIDLRDFDLSLEGSRIRSPENLENINKIIRHEGVRLTARETQNIIKCAHILGNVLTRAVDRRATECAVSERKVSSRNELTLDLKAPSVPSEPQKRSEAVTTQTDISLPNTQSAPRIFESILRQLSKSSIDEGDKEEGEGE